MSVKANMVERKVAFVFKIVLLLYLFFQSLVIFHRTVFVGLALWSMLLLGGILCVLRLTNAKKYIYTKGIIWLGLYLFSYVIAIICNYKYGISEDAANFIILFLTMAIVYVTNSEYEKKDVRREMDIISHIFIIIIDISIIASIGMLFIGYGDTWHYEDYIRNIGVVENRLWGVFADPNVAAIFSVVCMLLCIYFWKTKKCKWFYSITLVLLFLYLAFSDSRTGTVCLFAAVGFYSYMILEKNFSEKYKKRMVSRIVSLAIALGIAFLVSAVPGQLQNGYNYIIEQRQEAGDEEADKKSIKREYDLSQDVTNRRLEIWTSGIEIFMDSPITGIGFHHLQDYAREELPDTYLANKDITYSHLHNEILNVLVSQGLLGFIPILIFAISSIIDVFKRYSILNEKEYFYYTIGIGCLLTICIGIMLNQGIFYSYMPINLLFWMYLSYMRNSAID